ncbi:acetyl-CoA C-acetyltransferase [Amycolatopsis rhizosphaerae]|uniref:acetyl-CoA C-acyltransferase n=1 Tax=Amycolatopsis rhizosphaerae TaxID=2053003 RepID=A0A558DK09_9PSEU|nr:acetyl-CoA C-acetyltransferase [Amycolatopsis rhizosphaerae]TVT61330.1 acetyl-CoA C-acetyltransferase [Amycolatopsis rhizosphaerae]
MNTTDEPQAVLVAAVRSPIGRAYKGSLRELRADDLAAQLVRAALDQVPALDPAEVDELLLGCAQPAGEQGYGLGRAVAVLLGLDELPGATVQRYCASSLLTTRMAAHAIRSGEAHTVISAGVECVSRYGFGKADGMPDTHNPRFSAARARSEAQAQPWKDPRLDGGLPDLYVTMGQTAENVAQVYQVSRAAQDEYAALSQRRAEAAIASGFFRRDITPVALPDGTMVDSDDCPRPGVTVDRLAGLQPVFREDGTVTAGNCCPLNDGAAALVVMSGTRAAELGLRPLAQIVSTGVSALSPEVMGMGPVVAVRRALSLAGMAVADIGLMELNEAFAAQVLPCVDQIGIDVERVNVHGGAIALGHPFGQTGARLVTTLLHGLQEADQEIGVATMCAAGGQGMALVLERLA